ncbi:MAG: hypothetical protein K9M56_00050 [Victivallales bacterium]|nr:hypothetical protein [Victivallales bacterium]
MDNKSEKIIEEELEHFKAEKERIRQIVGRIGGKATSRNDRLVNILFVALLLILFIIDILHVAGLPVPITTSFTIILAILMVSMKMIWMMHKNAKVSHFQFWMLSSIEFRLNGMSQKINKIEDKIKKTERKLEWNTKTGKYPEQ